MITNAEWHTIVLALVLEAVVFLAWAPFAIWVIWRDRRSNAEIDEDADAIH